MGINEALQLNRASGRLDETAIIQCPKCGTKFEISARQLPEEEEPTEEAPPAGEKPAETPPAPAPATSEEEKKESLSISRMKVLACSKCQATRLGLAETKFKVCHMCGGSMGFSEESPVGRLNECKKMVESGVSTEKAVALLLGERV